MPANQTLSCCPQCNEEINDSNRLIKEVCGHDKCRQCFINENNGCQVCSLDDDPINPPPITTCRQTEVIKIKTEWVNKLSSTFTESSDDSNVLEIDTDQESVNASLDTVEKPRNDKKIDILNNILVKPADAVVKRIRPKKLSKNERIEHIEERPATVSDLNKKTEQAKIVYHCTICDKDFVNRQLRRYHLYCNKAFANPHKCIECNEEFNNSFHLNWHKAKKHKKSQIRCKVCDKLFPTNYELKRHEKSHSRTGFQCPQCKQQFPSRVELHEHSQIHDKTDYRHTCDICKTKYRLKTNLVKHMQIHEKTPFTSVKCDHCDQKFANRANMLVHAKKHDRRTQFKCSVCEKLYSDRATLARHFKQHQAKAGYFCKLCDMKSARKDNIIRHCRSFHPGKTGNFVGVVEKTVLTAEKVSPKDEEVVVEVVVDNRVSVIMSVGRPKSFTATHKATEDEPKTEVKIDPPPVATVKPVEPTTKLEIYRRILSPYPAKGSLLLEKVADKPDRMLPAVTVAPRGSKNSNDVSNNFDRLEIYRKILGPSTATSSSMSAGTTGTVTEAKNGAAGSSSSQFNFNEVHWRKRTSQNFMFK